MRDPSISEKSVFFVNFFPNVANTTSADPLERYTLPKTFKRKVKKNILNHLAVKEISLSNGRPFTEVNHRVEASFD